MIGVTGHRDRSRNRTVTHTAGVSRGRLRGRLTELRLAGEGDVELLVGWHAHPEVRRFWDDKTYTPETMRAKLARPRFEPYIIEERETPVGYIQAWWEEGADGGGVDMFMAPDARGRGLGPDAARALAAHLLGRGWSRVTIDPYAWNERALRAFEQAGFVTLEERGADEGHSAPWLLMEFRP